MQTQTMIDLVELSRLAKAGQREELLSHVLQYCRRERFCRTKKTEWAYLRVATFLEDGWQGMQSYVDIRPGTLPKSELGVVINRLVAGCRYDVADATRIGAPWVFSEGRADAAAFIFYLVTKCPALAEA